MAIRDKVYLRSKFETGDTPLQADFWDLIDSFKHVSEDANIDASPYDPTSWNNIADAPSKGAVRNKIVSMDAAIAGKAATAHTHLAADITNFNTSVDARITAVKAIANGLATLDASGKIPNSQLPPLAISKVSAVVSQTAQLALVAEEGDIAVRTDIGKSFIKTSGTTGTMSDWQELLSPTDAITSVNGKIGSVVLTSTDITEGTNLYYTHARGRQAVSVSGTFLAYNNTTGVLSTAYTPFNKGGDSIVLSNVASVGLAVRAAAAHTSDLLQIQDSAGDNKLVVDNTFALSAGKKSGTDLSGNNLVIKSGGGTGVANQSFIIFQTPTTGTTGTTAQVLNTKLRIGSISAANAANASLWLGNIATPSSTNYSLHTEGASLFVNAPSGNIYLRSGNADKLTIGGSSIITGASLSAVYRKLNSAADASAHLMVDPTGNLTTVGGVSFSFDSANGLGFNASNGTRRIQRWGLQLTNLVNTADAESADLTLSPKNPNDTFVIGGKVKISGLSGTTNRFMQVDSLGNISAVQEIFPGMITNSTIITQLTTATNWTGANYTGSAIAGAAQGQWYYNGSYYYYFVNATTPIRMARA